MAEVKRDSSSSASPEHNEVVAAPAGEVISASDDKRVLRNIDWHLQPVIMMIYFLVTLDKASLSYTSVFDIQRDAHLVGNEYSLLGSAVYIAQLAFQPMSALAIVLLPLSLWMGGLITLWGVCLACGAAATSFPGLFAMRFFLGGLESSIAPCNVALTQTFYRRSEQGFRTCNWYAMNGLSTIIGSAIAYGLGHIRSDVLHSYQIIFLTLGLMTVVYGISAFFTIPNSIEHAYFLKGDDKRVATERVRFNQSGTEQRKFNWAQAFEVFWDPKSWLWMSMAFLISVASGAFSTFQALVIRSFGFDKYEVMLLSMPVGVMQLISMYAAFYLSMRVKNKSYVMIGIMVPCLIGGGLLYGRGRAQSDRAGNLVAYYLTVCYVAVTPLLFNWHSSNVAGRTKRTVTTAFFVAGQAGGNIAGPLLFKSKDSPYYYPGLRACLIILCALVAEIAFTVLYLRFLNKRNERRRAARGFTGKLTDYSMMNADEVEAAKNAQLGAGARPEPANGESSDSIEKKEPTTAELGFSARNGDAPVHGARAFDDLTDLQNDEFIYVY